MEYNHPIPDQLSDFPTIGGGDGYRPNRFREPDYPCGGRVARTDANYVVETADELERAINDRAGRGEVVWIPGDVAVDVTGLERLEPAPGVIVASDRGMGGSSGALLYTADNPFPLFKLSGADSRLTGIRFKAPVTTHVEWDWRKEGTGVSVRADDVEIDNCVFRGWGHACVEIGRGGFVDRTHIHHNHFVDNPMEALGYGTVVHHGDPLVQSNYFDYNRHAIAADGAPDCSYTAQFNFCGPRTILAPFDMHRENEVKENGGEQAGKRFEIVENVVMSQYRDSDSWPMVAAFIRGVPLEQSVIAHNQFIHSETDGVGGNGEAYKLAAPSLEESNVTVTGNYYDVEDPRPRTLH